MPWSTLLDIQLKFEMWETVISHMLKYSSDEMGGGQFLRRWCPQKLGHIKGRRAQGPDKTELLFETKISRQFSFERIGL